MFSIEHDCTRIVEEVSHMRKFMSEDMSQTEEFLAKMSLPRTGEENDGHNILPSQQSKSQECDSDFPNTIMENDEKRRFVSISPTIQQQCGIEKVVKTDDHDPRSFSKDEHVQNDENEGLTSQHRAKTADSDTLSPPLMQEEIDMNEDFLFQKMHTSEKISSESRVYTSIVDESFLETSSEICQEKQGKYFFYDSPLHEETGIWIPVSIPPMSESDHHEWTRGFSSNGGYLPETDAGWGDCLGEGKELTMWDVVVEMLTAAKGKVNALASGEIPNISWMVNDVLEQAWKEMAQTLTESSLTNVQEILETVPPKWLPDSTASACMLCSVRFHPIMCTRHHCRFCGGIFCSDCTRGRSLLPEKFQTADPQRVCDVCCVRLESVQPYLMDQVSRAAQLPTHDLTDLSTLRSWVNFPWGQSMEYEIYKATNTIRGYSKVGSLRPEKRIPEAILRHAKGLAILTVVKVGVMVTYNIGTGLVIARREDGSWSPPSAILSFGVGWGAQAGGELTDLIIVLRSDDAIRTFSGNNHLSLGAGLSAAIGVIGRTAEADLRAGTSGYAACYTYSCSKGAFLGCSLEGSIVTTRTKENSRFYGSQSISAADILLGALPKPPAASILYRALGDLYEKL